jgi:hypothetical protein
MLAPHRKSKSARSQPRASQEARQSLSSEPEDAEASPTPVVLPSSTELFYFYGQSLEQCAKLSTGKPLFNLCGVQKKWLKVYAGRSSRYVSVSEAHCSLPEDVLNASLKRLVLSFSRPFLY